MERMDADKLSTKAIKAAEKVRLKAARRQAASGSSEYKSRPEVDEDAANPMMDDILESSERFDVRRVARDTEAYGVKESDLEGMPMAVKPEAIKTEMLPYQLQALQWLIDHENPKIKALGPEKLGTTLVAGKWWQETLHEIGDKSFDTSVSQIGFWWHPR
jgi:SWI/SNF-related matrix-associated actin-dependent regulator of chromatin subfamily A3